MQVFTQLDEFQPPAAGVALSIGNFDGVHLGHQAILGTARELAGEFGGLAVALTFEPHPLAGLAPDRAPPRLTLRAEKLTLLAATGAQAVIVLATDRALLSLTADEFLAAVVRRCRPRAMVEGPTFNFGRGRAGSVETLRAHEREYGYALYVMPIRRCETLPGAPAIDSSSIRRALAAGQVEAARALLGRPHSIAGTVVSGDARGRQLGFPTANLSDIQHMLPQEAVYLAIAARADGTHYLAAVNVGRQPTFGDTGPRVEAHLLDFAGELHGERLALHFLARLRGQQRFAGVSELKAQLQRDVAATRAFAGELDALRHEPRAGQR
jgi:riboflavin kinase / FMN adenylyltransferase